MPTNLPPDYYQVEKEYREAKTTQDKIALLQKMLSIVPKHKGTDHLRADLRRRLARLEETSKTRKGAGRRESTFRIDREGAGQVTLVGPANTGKSALVAALTRATPEVSDAPYATWTPTPGMMPIKDIHVQLIDTPSLSTDFVEPELMDLVRRSDLVLIVIDIQGDPIQQLEDTIAILEEHRIAPHHLRHRYEEEQRMAFVPMQVLVNKTDDESLDEDVEVLGELVGESWPLLPISATTGRYIDRFKQVVLERLEIIRIYSKPPGKEPDLRAPFVMKKGSTIEELAGKIHHDFVDRLKSARVWGSAEFDGQMVGRDYVLQDRDIVELHIRLMYRKGLLARRQKG